MPVTHTHVLPRSHNHTNNMRNTFVFQERTQVQYNMWQIVRNF